MNDEKRYYHSMIVTQIDKPPSNYTKVRNVKIIDGRLFFVVDENKRCPTCGQLREREQELSFARDWISILLTNAGGE